jgi:hypothetical protein
MLIMLPTQACLRAQAPLNPETAEEEAISRIFGPYGGGDGPGFDQSSKVPVTPWNPLSACFVIH